jgi:hypothetical protein
MKTLPLVLVMVVGGYLTVSCEKHEAVDSSKTSNKSTEPSEAQLMETKRQLASELSEQGSRIMTVGMIPRCGA